MKYASRGNDELRPRPRILVFGHAARPTGFARVLHQILSRLTGDFEFHHFDAQNTAQPTGLGWRIHPNPEPLDVWGTRHFSRLVRELSPDLVFIMHDIWVLPLLLPSIDRGNGARIVAYCPIDSCGIGHDYFDALAPLSAVVVYNAFAQAVLADNIAAHRRQHPEFAPWPVHVIGHGVDTATFRPHPPGDPSDGWQQSRLAARRQLGWPEQEARDAFIILNANRNDSRKRVDLTLDAFARFAAGKPPSVKLHLHMARSSFAVDLGQLARQHGIRDRVRFTSAGTDPPTLDDAALNLLYASCDVGVNTATAEGWGLVSFEHAATGAAQVMPRHSAFACLWEDSAVLVEPAAVRQLFPHLEERIVDAGDVAAAFETLYSDRAHRTGMAQAAYRNATRPQFAWSHIAEQWKTLFFQQLAR